MNIDGPSGVVSEDDNSPLWRYVTRLEKTTSGRGSWRWQYHYCHKECNGSYSIVVAHLMKIPNKGIAKCSQVKAEHLVEMRRLIEQAKLRVKNAAPKNVPLPTTTSIGSSTSASSTMAASGMGSSHEGSYDPRRKRGTSAIEKALNIQAREAVHAEIARMFYSGGLPFNLAKNPHYARSYLLASNSGISGYKPPRYNMLRTVLLQKEKSHIHALLEPIRESWKSKGVTIVSDGWTDSQRRPLINFMAVIEAGPMFLKAVNGEGEYKDKYYIAKLMEDVIKEVGPENVVQIITDNAAVCKAAGSLVEDKFKHIFWTPCVVHTLNLALKNKCAAKNTKANGVVFDKCSWITIIRDDVVVIRNFINNHSMRLAIYNKYVNLKMLAIAETRFASMIVMLKRFKKIYQGLRSMVVSEEWGSYRADDSGKAQFVRDKILDDDWWLKINYILSFTGPIYDMLRRADTDKLCFHEVYDMWDTMIEKVKAAIYLHENKEESEESSFFNVVHNILVERWEKSNTPLHCLAHSLNPRYYSTKWLSQAPNRVTPHEDNEISMERNKCMKRYFPNSEERLNVNSDFAKFSMQLEAFSDPCSIRERGLLEPHIWWGIYGTSTSTLQKLAFKLLGQPCSSSCSERNWSTYSFIHSLKRNKMLPERAKDLVYVHTNLRLLSRKKEDYMNGATKMWDVGGDGFDSMDGVGILEVANLSLDEPELEAIVFTDGVDEGGSDGGGGM